MRRHTNLTTLLLDLDGTLIDSRRDLVNAVNFALEKLGKPAQSFDSIVGRIGNGLRRLISDSLSITDIDFLSEAKSYFEAFYDAHCLDHTTAYAGVTEGVQSLSKNFRLGVVTNKPVSFSIKILEGLNLRSSIEAVIGGDSLTQSKPHPAPLEEAMRILKSRPDQTLMVGDGIQDMKAAQAAGVSTCIAEYGFGYRPELLALKPEYVIKNFSELKSIVGQSQNVRHSRI